jgi:hypothetical protein
MKNFCGFLKNFVRKVPVVVRVLTCVWAAHQTPVALTACSAFAEFAKSSNLVIKPPHDSPLNSGNDVWYSFAP